MKDIDKREIISDKKAGVYFGYMIGRYLDFATKVMIAIMLTKWSGLLK